MILPRILLDIDGVCADFTGHYLGIVERLFPDKVRPVEQITAYSIGVSLGLTVEQQARVHRELERPGSCSLIEPYPHARLHVDLLAACGYVYAVTAPWWSSSTWMAERTDWIWRHLGIPSSRVVHTSAKEIVAGDYMIEDNADTLSRWCGQWPTGRGVLIAHPYNADADSHYRAPCLGAAHDWIAQHLALREGR